MKRPKINEKEAMDDQFKNVSQLKVTQGFRIKIMDFWNKIFQSILRAWDHF